jgi:hypothetical protein
MGSIEAGAGHSGATDSRAAGREATTRALPDVRTEPAIVYVFASSEYDVGAVFDSVASETDATTVGCTTAGEIVNTGSYTETVAVLALAGDGVDASVAAAEFGEDVGEAASATVSEALSGFGTDGLATNVVSDDGDGWAPHSSLVSTVFADYDADEGTIMNGITDVVGPATVHGGLAADDWKYDGSAAVVDDGALVEHGLAVAVLDLDVKTGLSARHGIEPTDEVLTITAKEGATVREFNGRPALNVYEERVGPQVIADQFRITTPMGVDVGEDEPRIHAAHAIDEDERTMTFTSGDNLREGQSGRIMDPTGDDVIRGTEAAIQEALERAGDPDDVVAVMIHDCLCRWFFLSDTETRERELDAIRDRVDDDVPVVGWYTAGELAAPDVLDGTYNQTAVVWVITNDAL